MRSFSSTIRGRVCCYRFLGVSRVEWGWWLVLGVDGASTAMRFGGRQKTSSTVTLFWRVISAVLSFVRFLGACGVQRHAWRPYARSVATARSTAAATEHGIHGGECYGEKKTKGRVGDGGRTHSDPAGVLRLRRGRLEAARIRRRSAAGAEGEPRPCARRRGSRLDSSCMRT